MIESGAYMGNRLWKILIAEISYFAFVLLGIYAGHRFWKATMFSTLGEHGIGGEIFSYLMLIILILAMIPIFLLSLRRMLLKGDILTREEYKRYILSRTWFMEK